jgi:predicted O-methyltransferase YrrM
VIVDERIVTYMHSLEKPNNNVLEEIEQQAHIDGVPIIRKEMESFLRVMLTITKPKRILELGTAVGYSAILMSEAIEKDASIITIENYEKRIVQIRKMLLQCLKEMPWKLCPALKETALTLFLWMRQRHSIFIFYLKLCA